MYLIPRTHKLFIIKYGFLVSLSTVIKPLNPPLLHNFTIYTLDRPRALSTSPINF